ncbi:MAG: GH3 auxin-responsive promoter family protein [Microscillaceae bacterium]|nr:GH3 auxin-responsive promoter family protein [Microscillaceae bacterium]
MPILGRLLKQGIKLRKSIEQERRNPIQLQEKQLLHLIQAAKSTRLGQIYQFEDILKDFHLSANTRSLYEDFIRRVPLSNYQKMYNDWWHLSREGLKDIAWPGLVEYFALSSGTSEASSKYIPVTRDMIKAIHRASLRQILSLSNFKDLPSKIYGKGMLMLGGSTHLHRKGTYFEGDLSGITASQIPFWFQHFYKPGKRIAKNSDWDDKLHEIVLKAPKWDIGFVVGVPAWIQIMMERIIEHYQVKHIHEIWPNLMVYAHGGVSFEPYRKGFEKLLGQPITYIETYLASEGFIAFQTHPHRDMRLVLNNGIFYEFVPFNHENFTAAGELKENAQVLRIDEVNTRQDYALLLSSCAGAWRYLIGDTIRFTSLEKSEIIITGRTKHFLSLCGEHLSVDNMNKAIELVADELNMNVKEFTVVGIPYDSLFAHQWYVGTDDPIDEHLLTQRIDEILKELNDDYRVERSAALKAIYVKILPTHLFYQWMEYKGKVGGQNKFPRVLKKEQHDEWLSFIREKSN